MLRGIRILFSIEKYYTISLMLTNILSAFIPYINIYMTAQIVNELSDDRNLNTLILFVIITILCNASLILLLSGLNHLMEYHQEQFFKNEKLLFSQKSMEMDYGLLEKQETAQLRDRISIESQTGYNMYYLCTFLGKWISSLTNVIVSSGLTFGLFFNRSIQLSWRTLIILCMIIVIGTGYVASQRTNILSENMFSEFIPYNTRYNFYLDFLKNYNTGKDIRLYNMECSVADEQKNLDILTYKIERGTKRKILRYNILNTFTFDMLRIISYIIITLACLSEAVSLGSITQYVACTALFVSSISGMIGQTQLLFFNNRYLTRYLQFLDLPSQLQGGTLPLSELSSDLEIVFHHVYFRYPQSKAFVLKDFCLTIRGSERLAVVGMNGSGKTTMIKLLCRLYDPTEGYITLNGIDIRSIDYQDYIRAFGIVFQDFKLFSLPIAQNIAIGTNYDSLIIRQLIEKTGLTDFIERLPNNMETCLYKDFDENGYEISGGEAQKVALARALFKNSLVLILDEPTAALDPVSEAQIFTRFHTISDSKTTVFISHRLSSCRFCDKIAVIDNGQIVQYGTHDELLMNKGKKYYQLWIAQAQHYQ